MRWNVTFIRNNFNITKDVEDILKIYIPIQSSIDKRFWTYTKNGQVIIKSSYRVLTTKNSENKSGLRKRKDFWDFLFARESFLLGGNVVLEKLFQ